MREKKTKKIKIDLIKEKKHIYKIIIYSNQGEEKNEKSIINFSCYACYYIN